MGSELRAQLKVRRFACGVESAEGMGGGYEAVSGGTEKSVDGGKEGERRAATERRDETATVDRTEHQRRWPLSVTPTTGVDCAQ